MAFPGGAMVKTNSTGVGRALILQPLNKFYQSKRNLLGLLKGTVHIRAEIYAAAAMATHETAGWGGENRPDGSPDVHDRAPEPTTVYRMAPGMASPPGQGPLRSP